MPRLKVLFVAEAVTLAHIARLAVLARSLDPDQHEVVFASAPRYSTLLADFPYPILPIQSIPEERFLNALAHGKPLHDAETLRSYIKEDLAIFRDVSPHVVIGDLRHSLAISARKARVPYLSVLNAYWSPYAKQDFCVPDIPLVRSAGLGVANFLFRMARPFVFAEHCKPINTVLREHGFPAIGRDLRRMYADADRVLYPDIPELVPTWNLPSTHTYLGPILWSPSVPLPAWWTELSEDRPVIYLTLGSSGSAKLLPLCIEAIDGLPVTGVVASVAAELGRLPENVRVAEFLPGVEAARRASVVICNGGSPTSHQALAAGAPVLGIPSNMDQHLNMSYVAAASAGVIVRSDGATPVRIRQQIQMLLETPLYRERAKRIQRRFSTYDATKRFLDVLAEVRRSLPAN